MVSLSKPGIEEIKKTLWKHFEYYSKIGAETCRQQINSEREIGQQYSGRALYELVQNALDYCSRNILIALDRDAQGELILVAGNDGKRLSVDPEHDYKDRPKGSEEKRSDFHALCSIHTSNKKPDENIGHKGIGFKAVFSLAERVQVWSKIEKAKDKAGWWGIELHQEMNKETLNQRLSCSTVKEGWAKLLDDPGITSELSLLTAVQGKLLSHPVPSFYFPLPLLANTLPINISGLEERLAEMETLVVVPLGRAGGDNGQLVEKYLEELKDNHFYFVSLRKEKNIQVTLKSRGEKEYEVLQATPSQNERIAMASWPIGGLEQESSEVSEIKALASRAGLELSWPRVAVIWHDEKRKNYFYCYLPTGKKGAFNADFNADFYIGIDRTTVPVREGRLGDYNRALLEAAAELHLAMFLDALGFEPAQVKKWVDWRWLQGKNLENLSYSGQTQGNLSRTFSWKLLDPQSGTSEEGDVCIKHLGRLLFSCEQGQTPAFQKWAEMAGKYFNSEPPGLYPPLFSYQEFWEVSANWLDYFCPYSRNSQTWRGNDYAIPLCDALREEGARVVPVINRPVEDQRDLTVTQAVPLPDRLEKGEGARAKKSSRLFLLRHQVESTGKVEALQLPDALLERRRAVTTFEFPYGLSDQSFRPTGAIDMDRWALLRELRQLPMAGDMAYNLPGEGASQRQYEILRFAAQLSLLKFGDRKSLMEQDTYCREIGWRARIDIESEEARAAGRALATLFLPTIEEKWEPARQLTLDRVDLKKLRENVFSKVAGLDEEGFLRFLGISPLPRHIGLLLVEGGEEGLVAPLDFPPALVSPGVKKEKIRPVFVCADHSKEGRAEAVNQAWEWLSPLVLLEKKEEEKAKLESEIRETLQREKWFPVAESSENRSSGFARAPVGVEIKKDFIAPTSIVLQPEKGDIQRFKVLWGVNRNSEYKDILETLGAIRGLQEEYLEVNGFEPALRLMEQLKRLNLKEINKDNQARLGLVALYRHLFNTVTKSEQQDRKIYLDNIPVLLFMGKDGAPESDGKGLLGYRKLTWVELTGKEKGNRTWWIAQDEEQRKLLERFYPQLNQAVAEVSRKTLKKLAATELERRSLKVERVIKTDKELANSPELNEVLKKKIENLLPGLLALARTFPQHQQDIDVEKVMEKWKRLNFAFYYRVWEEISTEPWAGKSRPCYQQVLFYSERGSSSQEGAGREDKDISVYVQELPEGSDYPLRYFARALADKLLDNVLLEGPWGQGLTEYDICSGGEHEKYSCFLQHLEKNEASELEKEYKREMNPLSEEEEKTFRDNLIRSLQKVGYRLKDEKGTYFDLHRLTPEEIQSLQGNRLDLKEEDLQNILQQETGIEKDGILYTVSFECSSFHKSLWEEWIRADDRKERLVLAALGRNSLEEDREEKELARDLDNFASERFKNLSFSPENIAREWLKRFQEKLVDNNENLPIEAVLPSISKFKPVTRMVHTNSWEPVKQSPGLSENEKLPGDYSKQEKIKILRGAEAEDAFCDYVLGQVKNLLAWYEEKAWNIMLDYARQVQKKGLERRLSEARNNQESLEKFLWEALRVSSFWGNAGFDILGLAEEGDSLNPLRLVLYEVKAIPESGRAQLHISSNQLYTYYQYRERENILWKLIGVTPEELAYDLTAQMDILYRYNEKGLFKELNQKGIEPKEFTLTINKPKESIVQ